MAKEPASSLTRQVEISDWFSHRTMVGVGAVDTVSELLSSG